MYASVSEGRGYAPRHLALWRPQELWMVENIDLVGHTQLSAPFLLHWPLSLYYKVRERISTSKCMKWYADNAQYIYVVL